MKKKYFISISLLVISILLILFGMYFQNKEPQNIDKPPTDIGDANINEYTYEEAKSIIEGLYKQENNSIEVTEEDDGYHITIRDISTNKIKNELIMNKSGEIISEKSATYSNTGEIVEAAEESIQ